MSTTHLPTMPNLSSIDLNLLVALDALLNESSVTSAAKRTGVTQSAMSYSLARLRLVLGDELLVRTHAGMMPTPRARALAKPLSRALAELRSVVSSGTPFDPATARRSFTIATADYGALVLMPDVMKRLGREAPHIELVLRPVPQEFGDALLDERFDLVLSPYPEPRATLAAQKLFDERFVCVLRNGHPAVRANQRNLDLETFVALSHVQIAPGGTPGGVVDELLAKLGKARHVALRVSEFLVAPLVVATSDLVLTLPERVARVFAESYGLRVLEPPFPVPTFAIWQIWHERRRKEPAHAWLRGVLAYASKSSSRAT